VEWDSLPEIVKRPAPSLSRERGERLPELSKRRVEEAIDRLDTLLEKLYVGSIEFTVQNYHDIGNQMQIIRSWIVGKKE
jgi:hypothetical protein